MQHVAKPEKTMIVHPDWNAMNVLRTLGGTDEPVAGAYPFYRLVTFPTGTTFAEPCSFEDLWKNCAWFALEVPQAAEQDRHFGLLYDPHALTFSKETGCPWILFVHSYDLREQDTLIARWVEAEKAACERGLHACEFGCRCLRDTEWKCKYGEYMCSEHRHGDLCRECYEREISWPEETRLGCSTVKS